MGKTMRIILDDDRAFPTDPTYSCARTYDECISLISTASSVEYISLDYDLEAEETGMDVLRYMTAENVFVKHINIHSVHPTGIIIMKEYVEYNFPNALLTFNAL